MYTPVKKESALQQMEPTHRKEPIFCDLVDSAIEMNPELTATAQSSNSDPVNEAVEVTFPEILPEAVPHRDETTH